MCICTSNRGLFESIESLLGQHQQTYLKVRDFFNTFDAEHFRPSLSSADLPR
jgi:hypothetical protein